ncbi:maleylpyruvate isomerase N-terminal domain-containing protein [Luteimicrobium subarcticum]|uniref:Maleylpyruvate isomerase n=1 Tax=Luteimicrobium subarcticum TaxID=620910 RepID=A0A2M8WJN9_9MICO|nr:maleylpyruvate isomerase N-terminal domain-containing protein [Luteimicrobium subarcticum]PJI91151.1 maleylpyruvate isomerase [Luteimicrobium subarcticum]
MPARHDLVTDPVIRADLLLARRGTAFFSRQLGALSAADLLEPSAVPGWSRAHVVAHVGYHARALAQLLEEVRTGRPVAEEEAVAAPAERVAYGATLPPAALRHLHAHAAVHLSVEWRDLPPERWVATGSLDGRDTRVADTPWRRAREVWLGAVDLAAGATVRDVPDAVTRREPVPAR